MTRNRVPTYELYGELLSQRDTDPLHIEAIRDRSLAHDWTIQPHRHARLAQVFLVQTPRITAQIGALRHVSSDAVLMVAPPGVTHSFRFPEDSIGDVLTLRIDALPQETHAQIAALSRRTDCVLPARDSIHFAAVTALFDQLNRAYATMSPDRAAILLGLIRLVLTYLVSDLAARDTLGTPNMADAVERTHAEHLADRFCALIETHFASDWSVPGYADALGLSAPHLTRVCRQVLGTSPNAFVRQRRVLEARRLLEYTRLSISEIAHRTGYHDAAFFSRSFKAATGQSPKHFRETVAHT